MKLARLALASVLALSLGISVLPTSPVRAADTPQSHNLGSSPANSRQALGQIVHELSADGQSLTKVLDYLRTVSGANLVVNWTVLEQAGVMKDSAITLTVREVPLRKVLQLVLNQASPQTALAYSVDANVIQITSQENLDKQLITKVYIVDDLVMVTNTNVQPPQINLQAIAGGSGTQQFSSGGTNGGGGGFGGSGGGGGFGGSSGGSGGGFGGSGGSSGGGFFAGNNNNSNQPKQTAEQKGQELVDLIKEVIRPSIWSDKGEGGGASIRYFNGKLIVTAPASVHEAIGGPVGDSVGSVRFGM